MSTALATEPYRAERTQRMRALPTQAYRRSSAIRRTITVEGPDWVVPIERAVGAIARFGSSPTPAILLIFTITLGASLRTR